MLRAQSLFLESHFYFEIGSSDYSAAVLVMLSAHSIQLHFDSRYPLLTFVLYCQAPLCWLYSFTLSAARTLYCLTLTEAKFQTVICSTPCNHNIPWQNCILFLQKGKFGALVKCPSHKQKLTGSNSGNQYF